MTGFGSASAASPAGRVTIEVRGVNHRYLDTHVRLPREMAAAETVIRDLVRKRVRRGRVDVTVWWVPSAEAALDSLAPERLAPIQAALERARSELGLEDPVTLEMLLAVRDPVPTAGPMTATRAAEIIRRPLKDALDGFLEMREREGASLVADALKLLGTLEKLVARIDKRTPRVVREQGRRLSRRIADLAADVTLDASRVAQEVAVLADRMDVREEITRLGSHLDQARDILGGREGGRKLDFLVQEMLRETNTIGSKLSGDTTARDVVALKATIERIREQIQNLE